jgi:hypothetical protein
MGTYTRLTSEMTITPPLAHKDIPLALTNFYEGTGPLRLAVTTTEDDTPDGLVIRRHADAVEADDGEVKAYTIEQDLQTLVDRLPLDRTYHGYISGQVEDGDQWRLYVRDGKVVKVSPRIVWPADDEVTATA